METSTRIAVQAANLVHELHCELARPERADELIWRFRTLYQPQLSVLWRSASLLPGVTDEFLLPASVQALRVEGLEPDARRIYTMTGLTEDNTSTLVREVIEKLQWLAQHSLVLHG
jgi:hypothetical protein